MVAMRKAALLFALLTIVAFSGGVAKAQTQGLVTCTATAVPPVVRAEGIAELVGDIVLVCNTQPGAVVPANTANFAVNIGVSLNVFITNNINFQAPNVSDAVLIINENNCEDPSTTGATYGCAPDSSFQDPQFGVLASNDRLEWNEVIFPIPGADPIGDDPYPLTTTVRITGIRANASQLGVPDAATFPSTQITAFISITGQTLIPLTNNVLNVAVPILGLIVDPGAPVTGLQCLEDEHVISINLEEGFATSFKTQGVPTYEPGQTQWESAYYAPGSNNWGGASQGTRFLIRFFNIPEGVDISAPKVVTTGGDPNIPEDELRLVWVSGANANGAGGGYTTATDSVDVTLSGGFGSIVYEVVDDDPFLIEDIDIPFTVSWDPDVENDLPAVGSGQMQASFAPLSQVVTASASEPEPRFTDNSGDPETVITIVRCTTTLLFPFVTNQAGFDTGIAISNTSRDWLGTEPQTGACTIHYHGSTMGGGAAPPEQTSLPIAGGEQLVFVLSGGNAAENIAGAPEFQGYIIAVCEFQYGHGFAFITNGFGGIPALAQGYLALVIPVTDYAGRIPGVPSGEGALHTLGESLAH